MQENPYQAMLSVMGGEAGRQFLPMVRTGVVVSVSPLTAQLPGELASGDQVALITPDGERFIILCKAVALS